MKKLLTVEEVASYLKVNRYTVYRWIKSKKLETIKVGNQHRVSEEALQKFLNEKEE